MNCSVFEKNRKKILAQMENNSVLLAFSHALSENKYECNRNYFYLCGVIEYENIVLLSKIDGKENEMIFINPYDEFKAKWVGAPLSNDEVSNISGIANVYYLDTFDNVLNSLLNGKVDKLYIDLKKNDYKSIMNNEEHFAKNIKDKKPWVIIKNADGLFAHARTSKSKEEVEEISKAIEITKAGVENILSNIGPMYEYQIESYFDQAIKYNGATGFAFPTIAASGKNACCLHYSENNSMAQNGDLILFDLGASYNMYNADISRTFPISGKFTERQKQIYNIVLEGQELVFNNIKPGITTRELNGILVNFYAKKLKEIGLITDPSEVSKYYYHGVSHHLGLETHDNCEYTPLVAGAVISNEPGLYIKEEGIGIRIEDDILVTEDGAINLSKDIIKTVDEIEAFIAAKKGQ